MNESIFNAGRCIKEAGICFLLFLAISIFEGVLLSQGFLTSIPSILIFSVVNLLLFAGGALNLIKGGEYLKEVK